MSRSEERAPERTHPRLDTEDVSLSEYPTQGVALEEHSEE